MCLLLIAYRQHRDYPLLLLANRDEFYHRPTATAKPWQDLAVIAGRDLEAGGTWMGIAPGGRVAAVTNMREPGAPTPADVLSRGEIPVQFLTSSLPPQDFAGVLPAPRYRGFNALLYAHAERPQLVCAGNRHSPFELSPGFHGISNGAPDAPWPKVNAGCSALERLVTRLQSTPDADLRDDNFVAPALAILADETRAPVAQLPDTGVGTALEQALSSIFVRIREGDISSADASDQPLTAGYGTRASTLVAVDRLGRTQLWEQTYVEGRLSDPIRHYVCEP
ncbi:NRDE family protein [Microbulbifer sp. SA54]|uniref:NRDE family protein n=1 Tax=Microbulbifer sp. SA54 TaxID=3401577 RepID=UPI003AAEAA27